MMNRVPEENGELPKPLLDSDVVRGIVKKQGDKGKGTTVVAKHIVQPETMNFQTVLSLPTMNWWYRRWKSGFGLGPDCP